MDKEEIIEFLEEKLAKIKKDAPGAFNLIAAFERVIQELLNEE